MSREPITYIEGKTETHPPRNEVIRAKLLTGFNNVQRFAQLQFDAAWGGGRGGWFCELGHAVAEKSIDVWYPNR